MKALDAGVVGMLALPVVFCVLGPSRSAAEVTKRKDAREIMEAVHARDTGDKLSARMTMQIAVASGRAKVRKLQMKSMEFSGATKQLMIFESPADVRDTALLSVDYDAGSKDDDQWLYLPSLRKITRISGGEKSASFMGTDFSYADLTKQDPSDYDYELLDAEVRVGGEACWLIEARPRTDKAREETGYVKQHIWVNKQKLVAVQVKAWVGEGKKIKLIKVTDIVEMDGVWVPRKYAARTTKDGKALSTTILQLSGVRLNDKSVSEEDFTQRRLEQGG